MRKKLLAVIATAAFLVTGAAVAPAADAATCSYQRVFGFGSRGWDYYYVLVCTYDCRVGSPC